MESESTTVTVVSIADLMESYHAAVRAGEDEVFGTVQVAVAASYEKTTRSGNPYDIVTLADATGTIQVRDFRRKITGAASPKYVQVELKVEKYNDAPSAILENASVLDPETVDESQFCRFDREANDLHRNQLEQMLGAMTDGSVYQQLCRALLDGDVYEQFCSWPAAVVNHHNYKGGLIEHTLEVARTALRLAALDDDPYDKDLLLCAALLHDIGKLDEYDGPPTVQRGVAGHYAYHLAFSQVRLGVAVAKVQASGTPVPRSAVYLLAHCVEMSHGEHRLDKSRQPLCKEARALAAADDYSAKRHPSEKESSLSDQVLYAVEPY